MIPVCTHAQKAARTPPRTQHYATGVHRRRALSLLFNVVCTHIVRMHAINLYGEREREREGEGGREERVECAGEVSALNQAREGVAHLPRSFRS